MSHLVILLMLVKIAEFLYTEVGGIIFDYNKSGLISLAFGLVLTAVIVYFLKAFLTDYFTLDSNLNRQKQVRHSQQH